MASGQLHAFLRRLRRVVGPTENDGPSDAQLLQRFVQGRDEEAFELLVWRHGAMVLNVCRRVLRREHDSEDAFQATFLTLGRKAAAIDKRESVGSWLYKVAYRIALRARDVSPSRPLPNGPMSDPSSSEPLHELAWREVGSALDEEIQRLPEKYRVALVLCHLEGQTIESAARTLGCPPATVGTWLARARGLLRRRLARRGFDLSSVAEAKHVVAMLSAALVNATIRAAAFTTAEKAVAAGAVSASVAALTKGALRAMTLTRWTATTVVVLTLSLLSGAGALLAPGLSALEPAQASAAPHRPSRGEKRIPAVLFQWKFQKGQPFYQVFTTKTMQKIKVMNNDVTQKQEQTFYLQWTPEKKVDGRWIIAQKILAVKVDIDVGGNPCEYDSTRAAESNASNSIGEFFKLLCNYITPQRRSNSASNPLDEFFKGVVGAEFKLVLDAKTLEIVRIEGRKEFVNKLGAANKQMKPLIDKILSEDALKEMAKTCFANQLMSPARPGDSWNKRRQLDRGALGTYQITSRYTYAGKEGQLDRIKVESSLNYGPPARHDGIGETPFRIEKAAVGGNETGGLFFDRARGRLACAESNLKRSGKLTVLIGGQKTAVELSETQRIAVQTMDVNPLRAGLRGDEVKELQRLREENERLRRRLQAVDEALRREDKPK